MVQLVARKLGLMSHDLLRDAKKKKKTKQNKTNSTNSFGKYLSWVFFLLLQLHGDQKFQKTD
jgi:hypothetical protein